MRKRSNVLTPVRDSIDSQSALCNGRHSITRCILHCRLSLFKTHRATLCSVDPARFQLELSVHHVHLCRGVSEICNLPSFDSSLTYPRSLYRRSLKLSLDWAVQRQIWRGQAVYIRSLFEANKDVRDPRQQQVYDIRSDPRCSLYSLVTNVRSSCARQRSCWKSGNTLIPTGHRPLLEVCLQHCLHAVSND